VCKVGFHCFYGLVLNFFLIGILNSFSAISTIVEKAIAFSSAS
jgi:hypothetical protein